MRCVWSCAVFGPVVIFFVGLGVDVESVVVFVCNLSCVVVVVR